LLSPQVGFWGRTTANQPCYSLRFSPSRDHVLVFADSTSLHIVDLTPERRREQVITYVPGVSISGIAFSADERKLFVALEHCLLEYRILESPEVLSSFSFVVFFSDGSAGAIAAEVVRSDNPVRHQRERERCVCVWSAAARK
jgi:hypothetical protein